jgi:hypothetical protein
MRISLPRRIERTTHPTNTPVQEGVSTAYTLVYHPALVRRIQEGLHVKREEWRGERGDP